MWKKGWGGPHATKKSVREKNEKAGKADGRHAERVRKSNSSGAGTPGPIAFISLPGRDPANLADLAGQARLGDAPPLHTLPQPIKPSGTHGRQLWVRGDPWFGSKLEQGRGIGVPRP